jgi:uncharacterized iron-regulated membrane protein
MGSVAASERDAANKAPPRKGISLNRTIHRVVALLAALLMLWLGTTGSMMQLLDFNAILTHAPMSDPNELSMAEGMYGPANFTVIQVTDFSAATLPKGFDFQQAVGTVLRSAHAYQNQGDGPLNPMAWVELRVIGGVPIGQVMLGTKLYAFNALTGEPVTAILPMQIPQGGRLPPSLRQKLKTLHRFWNRGDTPGVYFEFLAGLVLWTLLITGLVMYFRLLSARARIGRRQMFWLTGGLWRGLHRSISVAAAVFLACMAFSGTWIGFESSASALGRHGGGGPPGGAAAAVQGQPRPPAAGGARRRNPIDYIIPLRNDEVQDMAATTLEAMQRLHPDMPIKAMRLRFFGQMKQGVVITGGEQTEQLVFNADTGQPASLTEPSYPQSNFPFGVQVHENMKHFHSGAMFGLPTRLMNLLAGMSLIFLGVSGLVMYFDMWLKRRKGGRSSLVWR